MGNFKHQKEINTLLYTDTLFGFPIVIVEYDRPNLLGFSPARKCNNVGYLGLPRRPTGLELHTLVELELTDGLDYIVGKPCYKKWQDSKLFWVGVSFKPSRSLEFCQLEMRRLAKQIKSLGLFTTSNELDS